MVLVGSGAVAYGVGDEFGGEELEVVTEPGVMGAGQGVEDGPAGAGDGEGMGREGAADGEERGQGDVGAWRTPGQGLVVEVPVACLPEARARPPQGERACSRGALPALL